MKFSSECSIFLNTLMFIDIAELEQYLESTFGDASQIFDQFVGFMLNDPARTELAKLEPSEGMIKGHEFKEQCFSFLGSNGHESGNLFEYAYELICYLSWYYSGGILELFKHRQAENKGPRIYLTKRISSAEDISALPQMIEVYRGMSVAEFESGKFGMSWSLNIDKAREFAFTVYHDEPRGVVVKSSFSRDIVFYYNPEDQEQEVAIKNGANIIGSIVCQ